MASSLPIEDLERQLRKRFAAASIELDRPKNRFGPWYLDVTQNSHRVIIQWQEGKNFGVSSSAGQAYGEGADELYPDVEATYGRVVSLLLSGAFTSLPEPVRLSELRKERGISQAELAEILNRQQGEVSKIERRQDVKLSTLRDYVASIGGTLEVIARMPDGKVQPITFDIDQKGVGHRTALGAER